MAYDIKVGKTAKVRYMEIGKGVIAATIGGTLAGAAHFMFLGPQFPGQYYGVNTATIIDWIVAFFVGIGTALYAKTPLTMLLGFGAAGTLATVGLLQQFGIIPTAVAPGIRVARVAAPTRLTTRAPLPTTNRTGGTPVGSYRLG